MHEQLVTVPTLQYHDLNVSWQDLLLEIKKDYKRSIISQVRQQEMNVSSC